MERSLDRELEDALKDLFEADSRRDDPEEFLRFLQFVDFMEQLKLNLFLTALIEATEEFEQQRKVERKIF